MKITFLPKPLAFERKETVLNELMESASPGYDFFLLIVLSCTIATFGLLSNSAAVIIGAMLVAPLMSPILGLSLSSVAGEQLMFRRAMLALLEGVLLAVTLSTLIAKLAYQAPYAVLSTLPGEVLSRTHPSPFDLIIALAGGAAAAYALAQPRISAALPGVAIATALMPPLCTIGIGIALAAQTVIIGASLLFLTNMAAITFAGILVFAWLGFRPLRNGNQVIGLPRSVLISALLVTAIAIPLVILSIRSFQESSLSKTIQNAVVQILDENPIDAHLVELQFEIDQPIDAQSPPESSKRTLSIIVTVRTRQQLSYQNVVALQTALTEKLERPVALQVISIPYTKLDPLIPPTATTTATLGPSTTSTITRTPTAPPTLTATNTSTPTDTATPTPTITPMLAQIIGTDGGGIYMRDEPNGRITYILPEGALVQITGERATTHITLWIKVRDLLGRTGWLPSQSLRIQP
jgi:uncharacterized hydrophobic protein (TIGR00271 family)